MRFQQFTLIARLCLGSRYGVLFAVPASLVVFAICAPWRYQGQHISEAVLLQSFALIYIWVIYLGNCLPWLKGARNNKNFRLIQSQKAICYWLAFFINLSVALLTLCYFVPFGHPEIVNAILVVGMSVMSARMNTKSVSGELNQIGSNAFGLVMLVNLAHWLFYSPFLPGGWFVFLIGVVIAFYLWLVYRNYVNWIHRPGYDLVDGGLVNAALPYKRNLQNK